MYTDFFDINGYKDLMSFHIINSEACFIKIDDIFLVFDL